MTVLDVETFLTVLMQIIFELKLNTKCRCLEKENVLIYFILYILSDVAFNFQTPKQGAETIVHACLAPSLEDCGGSYLSNCRETAVSPKANDQEVQNKLWSIMLSLIEVEKFADLLQ